MGDRLTERDFEGEFCLDCILHGEPNGCNKPGGTCNAYDFCFEAWDKLAEYEALGTPAELAELVKVTDCEYCKQTIVTVKMDFETDSILGENKWFSSTRRPNHCPMCGRKLVKEMEL